MHLDPARFERAKGLERHYEYRLHDDKRRLVEVGDVIVFSHRATGEELKRIVRDKRLAPSFTSLEIIDEVEVMRMRLRYGPDRERAIGVVAFDVEHVE